MQVHPGTRLLSELEAALGQVVVLQTLLKSHPLAAVEAEMVEGIPLALGPPDGFPQSLAPGEAAAGPPHPPRQ